MSAATSPCEPAAVAEGAGGTAGALRLSFAGARPASRLAGLDQRAPLRALFPHERLGVPVAVVVNTAGGLVGGDRLAIEIAIAAEAGALVTAQAAEKVYRSLGPAAGIDVAISVGADAWLEWLPQETILFDGSRLCRSTSIELAPGGRLIAAEMVVFGRRARGERFSRGAWRDVWRVRRAGRLLWYDAQGLTGDFARAFAAPACLDGAAAAATLICADAAAPPLALARALLALADADGVRAAATVVNGLLIVRWLGEDARRLRGGVVALCRGLRAALAGLPEATPRLWAM